MICLVKLKTILDEDFVNYKKCSMLLAFSQCTWKCKGCQNAALKDMPESYIDPEEVVERYLKNPLSEAIVFGGLEPFESFLSVVRLTKAFRDKTQDPIIVYTGYEKEEVISQIEDLAFYPNIIVKFGRYHPCCEPKKDELLGVYLASSNQYAEKIS